MGLGGVLSSLSFADERKGAAGGICGVRGPKRTGVTDCHTSDVGHWLAMTWFFARNVVQAQFGSSRRPTPTHRLPIEFRRGRRPRRPVLPHSMSRFVGRADHSPPFWCVTRGTGADPSGASRHLLLHRGGFFVGSRAFFVGAGGPVRSLPAGPRHKKRPPKAVFFSRVFIMIICSFSWRRGAGRI